MVRTIERRIQNQYQQISTTSIVIFIRYCPQFSTGTILIDSLPSGSMKLASQILEILIFSAFMKTTEQTRDNSPLLEMWSILWHDGIYTFCICFYLYLHYTNGIIEQPQLMQFLYNWLILSIEVLLPY